MYFRSEVPADADDAKNAEEEEEEREKEKEGIIPNDD